MKKKLIKRFFLVSTIASLFTVILCYGTNTPDDWIGANYILIANIFLFMFRDILTLYKNGHNIEENLFNVFTSCLFTSALYFVQLVLIKIVFSIVDFNVDIQLARIFIIYALVLVLFIERALLDQKNYKVYTTITTISSFLLIALLFYLFPISLYICLLFIIALLDIVNTVVIITTWKKRGIANETLRL